MSASFSSSPGRVLALLATAPLLLAACGSAPPQPGTPQAAPVAKPLPPAKPSVVPVEAEPAAPATQPALSFNPFAGGPVVAMLNYADKLRQLSAGDLSAEIARLGDPGDSPVQQMQLALALAQTHAPADLARGQGLLQRVASSPAPEAQPLQPLARVLAARYAEQRRVEDDRDRQAQQLRDSQKRIDQLNDRIEALRAIERSFARPNSLVMPPAPPAPARPSP